MRLYLKNIGKLKEADIKLEGITVVAGENNSGKSTVGKALYAVYNTSYLLTQKYDEARKYAMSNLTMSNKHGVKLEYDDDDFLYDKIHLTTVEELKEYFYEKLVEQNKNAPLEALQELAKNIADIQNVTIEEIAMQHLKYYIHEEFHDQISNLNSTEASMLRFSFYKLQTKETMKYNIIDNELVSVCGQIEFSQQALYVDDPCILEWDLDEERDDFHKYTLINYLLESPDKDQAIEQILTEKKLKNVLSLLNSVCEGELSFQNTITYRLGKTGKSLDIKNLSTGLKSFAILKTLLLNGSLSSGSVLILDEPEIHLHPEWQLVYAELIVLLQKEFKLTILLTTHSPYFLRALEVYAGVHKISDKCNYYFAKNEGQEAMIYDVTEDIEEIYKKLADPFQILENLRWQDDP